MREYQVQLKAFNNGLRQTDRPPVNSEVLSSSVGGYPDIDGYKSLDNISNLAILGDVSATFPFPQVLRLRSCVLVCVANAIYEIEGSTLVLRLGSLTSGTIWTVADFGDYILMTNGKVVVKRDGASKIFSTITDAYNPVGRSICAHKGQLIVTAPGVGV